MGHFPVSFWLSYNFGGVDVSENNVLGMLNQFWLMMPLRVVVGLLVC